jgi:hypothetical protein
MNSASGGTTPTARQQFQPGPDISTMTPQHKLPVSAPQKGGGTLSRRQPTHAVTGPTSWENSRDPVSVVGNPRMAGSDADDAAPCSPPSAGDGS